MYLIGVKLALHTPTHEFYTICLKGWPVADLEDLLGERLTTEVTSAFARMGFFHDSETFFIKHTSKEESIECLPMECSPSDSTALGYSSKGFPIINSSIVGERPISTKVLNVKIPWVPIIKRL